MIHIIISQYGPGASLTEVPLADRRAAPESQRIGVLISRAYDGGPEQCMDLCQCAHCQMTFPYVRGSGNVRGWCQRCNGLTCGRRCCDPCVHWREVLARMGKGMTWEEAKRERSIMVNIPAAVPTENRSAGGVLLGKG